MTLKSEEMKTKIRRNENEEWQVIPTVISVDGITLSPTETILYKKLQEIESLLFKITDKKE